MHDHGHDDGHHAPGVQKNYEVSDVQVKYILWAGVGIVILTLFGYIVGTFATKYFRAQPAIGDYRATPLAAQGKGQSWDLPVRLQVDPPRAQVEFKAEQNAVASSFGVVSEKPEIYRIPVETAMKIVAEKGLPKFQLTAPAEGHAPK